MLRQGKPTWFSQTSRSSEPHILWKLHLLEFTLNFFKCAPGSQDTISWIRYYCHNLDNYSIVVLGFRFSIDISLNICTFENLVTPKNGHWKDSQGPGRSWSNSFFLDFREALVWGNILGILQVFLPKSCLCQKYRNMTCSILIFSETKTFDLCTKKAFSR